MLQHALFFAALGVAAFAAGGQPAVTVVLEPPLESIELVRWSGDDGRIVVRHHDRLVVVHQGERLPDSEAIVASIGRDRIVFTLGSGGAGGATERPGTMIIISKTDDGELQQKVYDSTAPDRAAVAVLRPVEDASTAEPGEPGADGAVNPDQRSTDLRE